MYLKSIEVQGFKSFAHKLTFDFHPGITGIVGPNGSGKSNVADAVRWVLGEQSAKQLRGGSMQDVIFAGTESRKPQGFASVAITLDNSDHCLDIDFEEVTVTRRLYRSGESEYLINNSQVRLRDINEIFYDTGIGKEGYSIIGQGQIEKILSGKPDERRELFDEAAGIVKFKRRKAASLKKLAEEQQNLLRVNDILKELTSQLEPLRKQSESAKIYLDKKEQLKELEVNYFLLEQEYTDTELAGIAEKSGIAGADLQETTAAFEATKAEYDQLEQQIEAIDNRISDLQKEASESALRRQTLSGNTEILREQIRTIEMSGEHNRSRREAIAAEIGSRSGEKAEREKELREVAGTLREIGRKQKEAEKELAAFDQELAEAAAFISRSKNDVIGMLNSRASVKGRIQRYDTMREQMGIRKSEIGGRLLRLREEEAATEKTLAECSGEMKRVADEIHSRQDAFDEAEAKIKAFQADIAKDEQRLDQVLASYHQDSSRRDSLKAMAESYDGYGNGIRRAMEQKKRNPGIRGVVADLIDVPEQYEVAIETALGGSLRNIVTDNEATAKYMIEYLKANRLGRCTFLPLTSLRGRSFDNERALREEGVIGVAADLADTAPEYAVLKQYLLGRTLVVSDIDHAIRIGRKYHHSIYMVTLQGESFSPGGSITGGAFRNTDNLLGRKREIEELEVAVKNLRTESEALKVRIEEQKKARNQVRDQQTEINGEMHRFMLQLNTLQLSRKQAEEQLSVSRISRNSLEKENADIDRQIGEVEENSRAILSELNASEAAEEEIQKKTGEMEEHASRLQEQRDQSAAALEQVRVEYAAYAEKKNFTESDISRIEGEIARLQEEDDSVAAASVGGAAEIREKEAQIAEILAGIRASEQQAAACEEEQEKLREDKKVLSGQHKSFFDRRDELSQRISRLDKECFRLESQREKLEEAKEEQAAYLWEEYELTPSEAEARKNPQFTDRRGMKKEISSLKEGIRALGPVNVNAIEDYKNLLERHTFLAAQHEDLVKSEETLTGIITELDNGMRKQFREKFSAIQTEFDRAFRELFGGGHGSLELDPEADVLEAGISIIAHPPGKKLQNMMQLSGGEKSLTAIALLFAIQNLKPSPFCLLDEIEAALDDSNVSRFSNYLHKLTKNTQFIVITHRRGTMTAADRLYGITMQEKGVSTLISVNLIEEKLDA